MNRILLIIIILLLIALSVNYCNNRKDNASRLEESSQLIMTELNQVSKLVVTEGHFSEVFNYNNSRELFGDLLTSEKKALVVVNADVTVAYDLSKLKYEIDKENQLIKILSIPDEEIKINPELKYYDVQADFFNPFLAEDYNLIQQRVKQSLTKKIEQSNLKKDAKMRFLSELSKFYILTNSLGWTLQYNERPILDEKELKEIVF